MKFLKRERNLNKQSIFDHIGKLLRTVALPSLLGITIALSVLMFFGHTDSYRVGPIEAQVELRFKPGGAPSRLLLPVGSLQSSNHGGWWALTARPTHFDSQGAAAAFVAQNDYASQLMADLQKQAKPLVLGHIFRSIGIGCAAGLITAAIRYLRRGCSLSTLAYQLALPPIAAGLTLVGAVGWSFHTYNPDAPIVTSGELSRNVKWVRQFPEILAKLDQNRDTLVQAVGAFDALKKSAVPQPPTIKVLHISRVKLLPEGMRFARFVADEFDVDVVIDTGDLSSFGTPWDPEIAKQIPGFKRPYLFVPGNHDTPEVVAAVAAQPQTTVLADAAVNITTPEGGPVFIAPITGPSDATRGLVVYGHSHPRCSECQVEDPSSQEIANSAEQIAPEIRLRTRMLRPDIVAVNQDVMAKDLAGNVPLVLMGGITSSDKVRKGTRFLRMASTGAEGWKACLEDRPRMMTAQVLEFEAGQPANLVRYHEIQKLACRPNLRDGTVKTTEIKPNQQPSAATTRPPAMPGNRPIRYS